MNKLPNRNFANMIVEAIDFDSGRFPVYKFPPDSSLPQDISGEQKFKKAEAMFAAEGVKVTPFREPRTAVISGARFLDQVSIDNYRLSGGKITFPPREFKTLSKEDWRTFRLKGPDLLVMSEAVGYEEELIKAHLNKMGVEFKLVKGTWFNGHFGDLIIEGRVNIETLIRSGCKFKGADTYLEAGKGKSK